MERTLGRVLPLQYGRHYHLSRGMTSALLGLGEGAHLVGGAVCAGLWQRLGGALRKFRRWVFCGSVTCVTKGCEPSHL